MHERGGRWGDFEDFEMGGPPGMRGLGGGGRSKAKGKKKGHKMAG